jgi:uncharacterized protein YutE (UPF0331/DUF86 family)
LKPANDARVRLTRLIEEARIEIEALDATAGALHRDRPSLASGEASEATLALAAVRLHRYYTAVEALLERVARLFDESIPEGPTSHRDLLQQMAADLPPLRPALLDRDLGRGLHSLLGFRHFFRHAYDVALDVRELRRHADNLRDLHPRLVAALGRFLAFTRATRDALPAD